MYPAVNNQFLTFNSASYSAKGKVQSPDENS
jgi:hypothetical protein